MTEETELSLTKGQWSESSTPKRGWVCESVEDLGSPLLYCEMCDSVKIRYVHHMSHPDFSDRLRVGCICAGNMEGNYTAAKSRERSLRSKSANGKLKRARTPYDTSGITSQAGVLPVIPSFPTQIYSTGLKWFVSAKGNPCAVSGVVGSTVFKKKATGFHPTPRWTYLLWSADNGSSPSEAIYGCSDYPSIDEAKRAASLGIISFRNGGGRFKPKPVAGTAVGSPLRNSPKGAFIRSDDL
jgi:hypothetical protein